MRILLLGFKACGKTYFAKLIAKIYAINVYDTDQFVENIHYLKKQEKMHL